MKKLNQSYKEMEDVLPKDALWLKDTVTEIDPEKSQVTTQKGDTVAYDYMVVGTGIELDFEKVKEDINTVLCIVACQTSPSPLNK